MAVIWGLDLREMQWGKFKNSYMWNTEYHLRRTKFIVYQCAMIFCVVSESLGTAALSDYVDQQSFVAKHNPDAYVFNNDYIGAASYNIFVGIYVATIFGSGFFFDLFWPERYESPAVKLAWRICSVLACVFALASALTLTIITATHSAYVTGVDAPEATRLLEAYGGSPMRYRKNGRAIASVVFLWPGFVATVASTVILWMSLSHNDRLGPKSTHAREAEKGFGGAPVVDGPADTTSDVARPDNVHVNGDKTYEGV
ncbi:gpi ethanolamine phosphate transferase 2 [Diplodia corticola]|uniref:Gpi ethanolamine phosphate transferase 2 n=1 Tax=Diplodia corticola TaxID=236234 RepID=A0A1J9QUS1_9PEZI|nr:gpi ethanolamine phosphate transferase 2 [Diplodia corticola]OJD32145.1 gpi ethanolamine phosphate transferase 2 [Diplodia corticola]